MAVTKHKLFLLPISDGTINLEENVLSEINQFLAEHNFLYLNHSITTISKDELVNTSGNPAFRVAHQAHNQYHKFKNINAFLVISLVFKDLTATTEDVSILTPKAKKIVRKSVEDDEVLPKPNIETDFDKIMKTK